MSNNFFTRFRKLLPNEPLLVGVVVEYSGGVATIETPEGGRHTARGDAAVDDQVYFQAGVIQAQAPALTDVIIEV